VKLPAGLIHDADQCRAQADEIVSSMLDEMRDDLEDGIDPTALWWTVANSVCGCPETAAALASALLRLAQQG
jgi:hypothetical protein